MIEYIIPALTNSPAIAIRYGAAIWLMPLTGEKFCSNKFRTTLTICLTIISTSIDDINHDNILNGIVSEALTGAIYGLSFRICLLIMSMVGEIISNCISLSYSIPDMTGGNRTTISTITMLTALFVICLSSTPAFIIAQISKSNNSDSPPIEIQDHIINLNIIVSNSISSALPISSTFILLSISTNISLGYINKIYPTLPIVLIFTPITILFGLVILAIITPDIAKFVILFKPLVMP